MIKKKKRIIQKLVQKLTESDNWKQNLKKIILGKILVIFKNSNIITVFLKSHDFFSVLKI